MKRALITGVNGFVGKFLAKLLIQEKRKVFAIDQALECTVKNVEYRQANIIDNYGLLKVMEWAQPDEIYHLAAISYLPDADASPQFSLRINILGSVAVLDAVMKAQPKATVLLIGSSTEYGSERSNENITEKTHPEPTNFYAISKYSAEMVGREYVRQFGLDIRFTRSFNHTGPGQAPKFVCSDWARQVAEIDLGLKQPHMHVGDLNPAIDFADVRDVVDAYYHIVTKGQKGEIYNVCNGRAIQLKYILDYLTAKSKHEITINTSQDKLRLHKTNKYLVGSKDKIVSHTGWKPRFDFDQTLDDLYRYWIEELEKNS